MNFMGKVIAQRLHEVVENGNLGYEYTFDSNRDKNKKLRRDYFVNEAKMKEILLELNETHYQESRPGTNEEHISDTVHIFKINKELMPRYKEEADYVTVSIYIKVTWPDGEPPMFIISFHEDE